MGYTQDLPRVDLRVPPSIRLDDDLFFALCQANRDCRIERTAEGDIQIMPPTGGLTGKRNCDLVTDVNLWARQDGRGLAFDSSTGYTLPNGAVRSPDCSWVLRERLARLTAPEQQKFLPLAPDFVIELASPSDERADLIAKMREYQSNGERLGWLILPVQRQVYSYPDRGPGQRLDHPDTLTNEAILPGLTLSLAGIWAAGF